jgi:hypothetical protein
LDGRRSVLGKKTIVVLSAPDRNSSIVYRQNFGV